LLNSVQVCWPDGCRTITAVFSKALIHLIPLILGLYFFYMVIYMFMHVCSVDGGVKQFGPVFGFATPSPAIALEGQSITLRCFFYG